MNKLLITLLFIFSNNTFSQLKNIEVKIDTIKKVKSLGIQKNNTLEFNVKNGKLLVNKNVIIQKWSQYIEKWKSELKKDSFNSEWQYEEITQETKSLNKLKKLGKFQKTDKYSLLKVTSYVCETIESGNFELYLNEDKIENLIIIERRESSYNKHSSYAETLRYYITEKNERIWQCVIKSVTGCM